MGVNFSVTVTAILRDQNGVRPKSLKECNGEHGGVYTCLLNEPQMRHSLPGGLGVLPQNFFGFWGHRWCIPVPVWVTVLQYAYIPSPLQNNFLFRFTLISRMVPGVGKKSEIRLKSENFDPCILVLSLVLTLKINSNRS